MITYNKEKMVTCVSEMKPLFLEQYIENEGGEMFTLNPDYERYQLLEDMDVLHTYVARDDDEIIGYLVVMAQEHLHHKGIKYAISDLIYVAPEHRKSMVAYNMIMIAEEDLKQLGVKRLVIAMKIKQQFRELLSSAGFMPSEELWEKSI